MDSECVFCDREGCIYLENDLAYARYDKYPISKGHLLVLPKRHEENYFNLYTEELASVNSLIVECHEELERKLSPDGFNVGINIGRAAGQTVMHAHIHVIPRYKNDVPDPRGGIRWINREKAVYWD